MSEQTETKKSVLRKLSDVAGNTYMFEVPPDVDANDTTDILQGAKDGICHLLGHKLAGQIWLDVNNQPLGESADKWNSAFYKRHIVTMQQPDFGNLMKELIDRGREKAVWGDQVGNINRPILVTFRDRQVQKGDLGGYFIDWEVPCSECNCEIKGRYRLIMNSEGTEVVKAQGFHPNSEEGAKRRYGTSHIFCRDHAHLADIPQGSVSAPPPEKPVTVPVSDPDLLVNFMPNDRSVTTILKRLRAVTGANSDRELIPALGCSNATIYNAKLRGAFAEKMLVKIAGQFGLQPNWVETGLGHPIHGVTIEHAPPLPEPVEEISEPLEEITDETDDGPVEPVVEQEVERTVEPVVERTVEAHAPSTRFPEGHISDVYLPAGLVDEIKRVSQDDPELFRGFVLGAIAALQHR